MIIVYPSMATAFQPDINVEITPPSSKKVAKMPTTPKPPVRPFDGPGPRCAVQIESQILAKQKLDAAVLGLHLNGLFNPSGGEHYQGIQRYDHESGSYLYLTQDKDDSWTCPLFGSCDKPGRLIIAHMGSQANQGAPYGNTRNDGDDKPPDEDQVLDIRSGAGFAQYRHPGGMAIMENILAVGMEGNLGDNPKGRVDFYEIINPITFDYFNKIELPENRAASVGLTRDFYGKYLVAVADNSPRQVIFFRSTNSSGLDSNTSFERISTLTEQALQLPDAKYIQNVDLISECKTGVIYMIIAYQKDDNEDRIMRYRLFQRDGEYLASLRGGGEQVINCSPPSASNICTLNAAFGAYVGARGQILYYATEKENKGPGSTTEFGEFDP